jgi:uncharacterized protein (TIGR02996 family)
MTTEEELLAKILASPYGDESRKQVAALLEARGDPRGEFIRVQMKLLDGYVRERLPDDFGALVDRETKLLAEHGDEWSREVKPLVDRLHFDRGFVDEVSLSADAFLDRAEAIYRVAPVIHLNLTGVKGRAKELFASPHLGRIRALNLAENDLGDEGVAELAGSPHLGKLRWLSLRRNGITGVGAEALVASPNLPDLKYVDFSGNDGDPTDSPGAMDGMEILEWHEGPGSLLEKKYGPRPWLHYRVSNDLFRFPRMGAV